MKFTVYLPFTITQIIRGVEAEDADDALNQVDPEGTICAHCSQKFDMTGDANWDEAAAEPEADGL